MKKIIMIALFCGILAGCGGWTTKRVHFSRDYINELSDKVASQKKELASNERLTRRREDVLDFSLEKVSILRANLEKRELELSECKKSLQKVTDKSIYELDKLIVAPGDWLSSISKAYYGNILGWVAIWEANENVKNPDMVFPGQVLRLPIEMTDEELKRAEKVHNERY